MGEDGSMLHMVFTAAVREYCCDHLFTMTRGDLMSTPLLGQVVPQICSTNSRGTGLVVALQSSFLLLRTSVGLVDAKLMLR